VDEKVVKVEVEGVAPQRRIGWWGFQSTSKSAPVIPHAFKKNLSNMIHLEQQCPTISCT
jgi:hypothetical protein